MITPEKAEEIRKAYQDEGLSLKATGERFGLTPEGIRGVAKRYGWETRSRGKPNEASRRYTIHGTKHTGPSGRRPGHLREGPGKGRPRLELEIEASVRRRAPVERIKD